MIQAFQQFCLQHQVIVTFIATALVNCAVTAMPSPQSDRGFYRWLFDFSHLFLLNITRIIATRNGNGQVPNPGPGIGIGKAAIVIFAICLAPLLTGCPSAELKARDVIAAGNGAIVYAQGQYRDECTANPSLKDCVTINRAVGLENTAIDALKLYCSGVPKDGNLPFQSGGPCAPDKSYISKLQQALTDLNSITNDLKLLQKGKSK